MRNDTFLILDATCGSRMMWFNKSDERALYFDKRNEAYKISPNRGWPKGTTILVSPDVIGDFTNLPFCDEVFYHVIFDPPHSSKLGNNSILAKRYGKLFGDWTTDLAAGFSECFRVLKPNGTLIFKWSSTEFPLSKVVPLSPVNPLYGHNTGHHAKTHWIAFIKPNNVAALDRNSDVPISNIPGGE